MPFEILGTFNQSQFNRLVAFARERLVLVDARIRHLTVEQLRVGFLQYTYDTAGRPTGYSTGSEGGTPTYIGRLMAAYEVLGGDPFYDLQVRSMGEPVYRLKGDEQTTSKVLSNGEPIPQPGLSDGPSGNAVRLIKSWMSEDLERLERLERKVRRMVDYSDQLGAEIAELQSIRGGAESDGSLENLVTVVQQLLLDPDYRAIADDKGKDPFGKFTYAPMSSYEPGGTRQAPSGLAIERTTQGYSVIGEEVKSHEF